MALVFEQCFQGGHSIQSEQECQLLADTSTITQNHSPFMKAERMKKGWEMLLPRQQ
jgi:hypothetical protein